MAGVFCCSRSLESTTKAQEEAADEQQAERLPISAEILQRDRSGQGQTPHPGAKQHQRRAELSDNLSFRLPDGMKQRSKRHP